MKCIVCGSPSDLLYKDLFDDRYGAPGFYSIYRCTSCGFGRTHPMLKRREIGDYYKRYYPLSVTSAKDVKNSVFAIPQFFAWLAGIDGTAFRNISSGTQVLDVGSGSGASLLEIKKMGSEAWGVEPDPNAQKITKKLDLKVFKGFITDDPFPARKFDYVTGNQVFEHEPNPLEFLLAAKKKLKKGGQLILSFPNFDSVYRRVLGRMWLNWHVPYHINFFTRASIEKLASRAGLGVSLIRTVTPNIWSVYQIRKMFTEEKMGRKSHLWLDRHGGLFDKILTIILFMSFIPINRLVDISCLGDSVLVIIKNAD